MVNNKIDILAMESLDDSLFPYVVKETKKHFPEAIYDQSGIRIRLTNGNYIYILNAREYNTKENLHILTIGYSMNDAVPKTEIRRVIDKGLENGALIVLDHPFIDNGKTRTAGHISEELEQELEEICKEYSGQITLEWNGYCIPWMRRVLKFGLNALTNIKPHIKYHDVNKRVEKLSEALRKQGYNVPVVADTDLHARTKIDLKNIGTSRIITPVEGEAEGATPREVIKSMRRNIFIGDYRNIKRYVSFFHLLKAFCVPMIFQGYFDRPRG